MNAHVPNPPSGAPGAIGESRKRRKSGLHALQEIQGLASDLMNQNIPRTQANLDQMIRERFGPDADIDRIRQLFDDLQSMLADLDEPPATALDTGNSAGQPPSA